MAKRRANGEGNIRKRKDGRWEGRYTAGYDPETGKRIIKNVLGKTQPEVKEKLKQAVEDNKKINDHGTGIPYHEVEALARVQLPEIQAFFESEDGQREFAEWKVQQQVSKDEQG